MVAAGGGGSDCYSAGDGGALESTTYGNDDHPVQYLPGGANQTHPGTGGKCNGYSQGYPGAFGVGGRGYCYTFTENCDSAGSGGGGYFGGGGIASVGGGTGGSSFISGYEGCDAISKETDAPTGQPVHYSGLMFSLGRMFAGFEEMPSFNNIENATQIGNTGHGFARITYLYNTAVSCKIQNTNRLPVIAMIFLNLS